MTILADRGYRYLQRDVQKMGFEMLIPAIQQASMTLGDVEDSQPMAQSQPTSQPLPEELAASQPRSQPGSQPTSQPDSQPGSQPTSQPDLQPTSQPNPGPSSLISSQPISSQGYYSGRMAAPKSTKAKDKYLQSGALSCSDANKSRLISSRRHCIENINAAIKRFKFFSNVVPAERLDSGVCYAGLNVIGSLLNMRFLNNTMIMGMGSISFNTSLRYNFESD